jgi:hypothetical protein
MRKHLENVSKLMLENRVAQQAKSARKSGGVNPKKKAAGGRNART